MSDIEKEINGIERLVVINTENQVVNYFSIKLKECLNCQIKCTTLA